VHFHFERERDEVWLIPTSSAGRLRLDSIRVGGKCRLNRRCLIEVATLTIEVRWSEQSQVSSDGSKTQAFEVPIADASGKTTSLVGTAVDYARQLPGEGDTTRIGAHGDFDGSLDASFPTEQIPLLGPLTRQLVTERMPVFEAPSPSPPTVVAPILLVSSLSRSSRPPALPGTTTQRIEAFSFGGQAEGATNRVTGRTATPPKLPTLPNLMHFVTRLGTSTQQHPARVLAIAFAVSGALGAIAAGIAS